MTSAEEMLAGYDKVPSFKFVNVGDTVKGVVTALDTMQCRDIKTGLPENWPDGNPKMQLIVTLQTDLRDPAIDDDTGLRRIFAKNPGNLLASLRDAGKTAGASVAKGGRLAVRFSGTEPHKTPGFSPIKHYIAQYEPPASTGGLLDEPTNVTQTAAYAAAGGPVSQPSSDDLF